MVVALPDGADGYTASLGKRTRKNLRNYENGLRLLHPDTTTTIVPPGPESRALVEQFLAWHLERSGRLKIASVYVTKPEQRGQLALLAAKAGESQVTAIAGRPAPRSSVHVLGRPRGGGTGGSRLSSALGHLLLQVPPRRRAGKGDAPLGIPLPVGTSVLAEGIG